jgi:hypothetical protein
LKTLIIKTYKNLLPIVLREKISILREGFSNSFKYLLRSIKFIVFNFFWITPKELKMVDKIKNNHESKKKEIIEKGGKIADYESLIKFKKSDTLFILGSGSSINDISESQWAEIKKHDSIGFNLFILHSFIPTYYHLEFTEELYSYYKEILDAKLEQLDEVPLLTNYYHVDAKRPLSDYFWLKNNLITNAYYMYSYEKKITKLLKYFYSQENAKDINFTIHYRGSLTLMMSLGVLLGYKNIVLMGIDLNNNEYFFHNESLYHSELERKVRNYHLAKLEELRVNNKMANVHGTIDKSLSDVIMTIDKFILIYKKIIQSKKVNILLGSKKSFLESILEQYNFK